MPKLVLPQFSQENQVKCRWSIWVRALSFKRGLGQTPSRLCIHCIWRTYELWWEPKESLGEI